MSKTKKHGIQLTRTQVFFTSIALTASLLVIFTLGVLIGSRFPYLKSPVQNASVKPPTLDHRLFESLKTGQSSEEKNITQFTFYDTLPKRFDLPLIDKTAKVKAKNKQRIPATKKGRKKGKPFDQDLTRERYTIQLGSFKQKEKAYALQNKLKKQGYLAYVTPKKINGKGTWYRVRMGNFNKPEEAHEWVTKLGTLSPPPFITSNID